MNLEKPELEFLVHLFDVAVESAQPAHCLPACLPQPPARGDLILLATGKAGAAMARAALDHYFSHHGFPANRIRGLVTTRHGYGRDTSPLPLIEAGHPVPDSFSQQAALKSLEIAASAKPGDLVLVLISGGGSALWSAPRPPLTLADKQNITKALLRSGAAIDKINLVRKHLSLIKNGGLAAAVAPAVRIVSVAISDVPGDDPASIASGPTFADSSTCREALSICEAYNIHLTAEIRHLLETGDSPRETRENAGYRLAATPAMALSAARSEAEKAGFKVVMLGDAIEGEAREVARAHAGLALELQQNGAKPTLLLSGGELTVTLEGKGRGGPNQEYALALAIALEGRHNIFAIACDTDGADGGTGALSDPAGAVISPETIERAAELGISPFNYLRNNDSFGLFSALGDLIVTGPTYTNVNDLRIIMVNSVLNR